jgi:ABC-type nitrate/sulfonate/bicarbonate transport system permease component
VFHLRAPIPAWQALLWSALCIALCYAGWWYVTRGDAEERIIGPLMLPSPEETFAKLDRLWHEDRLAANIAVSLRRVVTGFGLAVLIGVPVGVLCGCFSWINAFFAPLTIFGRNAPMAALLFLTFALFGSTSEKQKYMFIFLSCVSFIVGDATAAIREIGGQYVDTAFTLGASRLQVIFKVLFPLALPSIFNSLRLLFGLAFGYIMLAEVVTTGGHVGGIGYLLNLAQSRGANRPYIILIVLIIPALALAIDRVLFFIQRQLFPYRYGGKGYLHRSVSAMLRGFEDLKGFFFTSGTADQFPAPRSSTAQPPQHSS